MHININDTTRTENRFIIKNINKQINNRPTKMIYRGKREIQEAVIIAEHYRKEINRKHRL